MKNLGLLVALVCFCTQMLGQNYSNGVARMCGMQNVYDPGSALVGGTTSLCEDEVDLDDIEIIIPVVVHVFHNNGPENISDAQIYNAINTFNSRPYWSDQLDDWGELNVKLALAHIDPDGNCTTGINRIEVASPYLAVETVSGECGLDDECSTMITATEAVELSNWPIDQYLNIRVFKGIACLDFCPEFVTADIANDLGGWGIPPWWNDALEGVYIHHKVMGYIEEAEDHALYTLSHEVGHFLGLKHPHRNWPDIENPECDADCPGSIAIADHVCDTPVMNTPILGQCDEDVLLDYCPDDGAGPDQMSNMMCYPRVDIDCSLPYFTEGQESRMECYLVNDANRFNLWQTTNVESKKAHLSCVDASVAPLDCSIITGLPLELYSDYYWDFGNGMPLVPGEPGATIYDIPSAGEFTVSLFLEDPGCGLVLINLFDVEILPSEDCPCTEIDENNPIIELDQLDCNTYRFSTDICFFGYDHQWYLPGEVDPIIEDEFEFSFCLEEAGTVDVELVLTGPDGEQLQEILQISIPCHIAPVLTEYEPPTCSERCDGQIHFQSDLPIEVSGAYDDDGLFDEVLQQICLGSSLYEVEFENGCTTQIEVDVVSNTPFLEDFTVENLEDVELIGDRVEFTGMLTIAEGFDTEAINLAEWYFQEGASIEVMEGARLRLVSSTLQGCDGTWEGIHIHSDDGIPGTLKLSGTIADEVVSPTVVSDARVAISSSDASPVYSILYDDDGNPIVYAPEPGQVNAGKLEITRTHFINNLQVLDLQDAVDLVGESEFQSCLFEVNDALYESFDYTDISQRFAKHVFLFQVQNLDFVDCEFRNDMSNVLFFPELWLDRGRAIQSVDAKFEVNSSLLGSGSSFSGFYTGIESTNTNSPWNHLRIIKSDFTDNQIAMHFNNVCWHDVIQNTIEVGPSLNLPLELQEADVPYEGIFQQMGAYFIIAENTITGIGEPIDNEPFVGIRIRDTGARDNEVYRNFLFDLTRGCQAEGDNVGSTAPWDQFGLRFVCNEFTDCEFDLINANNGNPTELSWEQYGLEHDDQGMPLLFEEAAELEEFGRRGGNSFTLMSFPELAPTGHWHNEGSPLLYWCGSGSECPEFVQFVNEFSPGASTPSQDCPSVHVELVNGLQQEYLNVPTEWILLENSWNDVVADHVYLLSAIIDGGETEDLQEEVEFAWVDETWVMRDELLFKSPFLSRDVLTRVADNTATFPHVVAFEIFAANPNVLRDARFMEYLETKADPMPTYLVDLLYLSRDQETFRTTLERNIAIAASAVQRSRSLGNRIRLANIPGGIMEISGQSEVNQLFDLRLKTHALSSMGYFNEASILTTAAAQLRLSMMDRTHLDSWIDYLEVGLTQEDWQDSKNLTTSQWNALQVLATNQSRTWGGQTAASYLNLHAEADLYLPPSPISVNTRSQLTSDSNTTTPELSLRPNPASDQVLVQLPTVSISNSIRSLSVFDLNHRLVWKVELGPFQSLVSLNTASWPSGMYIVQSQMDGTTQHSRLEIIH